MLIGAGGLVMVDGCLALRTKPCAVLTTTALPETTSAHTNLNFRGVTCEGCSVLPAGTSTDWEGAVGQTFPLPYRNDADEMH